MAPSSRDARVGNDQLGVDLHPGAETVAVGAGAERRVERERARLELVVSSGWSLGQAIFSENAPLARGSSSGRSTKSNTTRPPASPSAVSTESVSRRLALALDGEPVDDDLDGVLLLLVQRGRVGQRVSVAVDPGAREALGLELAEQVDVLALAAADHRRQHLEAGALLESEHPVDDLLGRLARDRRAADRAVRAAGAGVEQPEVVVDLGDRADRRAGVLRGRLLVDRDRGRQALDEVDVGLVHLAEELAGVGRERLDVAPLTLGEDRVERQAGLAGTRQPGEDDEGVARQVERDVLQVVLAGSPDDQLIRHYVPFRVMHPWSRHREACVVCVVRRGSRSAGPHGVRSRRSTPAAATCITRVIRTGVRKCIEAAAPAREATTARAALFRLSVLTPLWRRRAPTRIRPFISAYVPSHRPEQRYVAPPTVRR